MLLTLVGSTAGASIVVLALKAGFRPHLVDTNKYVSTVILYNRVDLVNILFGEGGPMRLCTEWVRENIPHNTQIELYSALVKAASRWD
jgi:hypothetical protein